MPIFWQPVPGMTKNEQHFFFMGMMESASSADDTDDYNDADFDENDFDELLDEDVRDEYGE